MIRMMIGLLFCLTTLSGLAQDRIDVVHEHQISALAFSPRGDLFLSADSDGVILVWQGPEWEPIATLTLEHLVIDLSFARDQTHCLAFFRGGFFLIDVQALEIKSKTVFPDDGSAPYVATVSSDFSADGSTFAVGFNDAFIYSYPSLERLKTFPLKRKDGQILYAANIALSPDGSQLAITQSMPEVFFLFDVETGKIMNQKDNEIPGFGAPGRLGPLTFSPDSQSVTVGWHNQLQVFTKGDLSNDFKNGHLQKINALAFTPDGRFLISAGEDMQFIVRSTESDKKVFRHEGVAEIKSMAISPNGKTLVLGGLDQTLSLWSLEDPTTPTQIKVIGDVVPMVDHMVSIPAYQNMRRQMGEVLLFIQSCLFCLLLIFCLPSLKERPFGDKPEDLKLGSLLGVVVIVGLVTWMAGFYFLSFVEDLNHSTPMSSYWTLLVGAGLKIGMVIGACIISRKLGWHPFLLIGIYKGLPRPHYSPGLAVLSTALVLAGACGWTFLLFSNVDYWSLSQTYTSSVLFEYLTVVFAGFEEEILFRLVFFSLLALMLRKMPYHTVTAAIISSALWALFHYSNMDPLWLKLLQIFPIGLGLCYLYRKYGLEVCILVHALFNVLAVVGHSLELF